MQSIYIYYIMAGIGWKYSGYNWAISMINMNHQKLIATQIHFS